MDGLDQKALSPTELGSLTERRREGEREPIQCSACGTEVNYDEGDDSERDEIRPKPEGDRLCSAGVGGGEAE
nr:unnamed protein product [Digitaria exilis]